MIVRMVLIYVNGFFNGVVNGLVIYVFISRCFVDIF